MKEKKIIKGQEKLKKAYEHLRWLGKVSTQKEFANVIGYKATNLSSAFNNNPTYLTKGLFNKICDAFPGIFNLDYFLEDTGEMLSTNEEKQSTAPQNDKLLDIILNQQERIKDLEKDNKQLIEVNKTLTETNKTLTEQLIEKVEQAKKTSSRSSNRRQKDRKAA